MQGKKFLHSIRLKNLLSYGSEGVSLDLEPLNVLIGPNASGKSNLIEAVSLLAAAPRDLPGAFRGGGTPQDWLWKGSQAAVAEIEASVLYPQKERDPVELAYRITFTASDFRLRILEERFESHDPSNSFSFHRNESLGGFYRLGKVPAKILGNLDPQQSVLSQFKDPVNYPELTYAGEQFGRLTFFRGWSLGRDNPIRRPQEVNLPDDFLLEDVSNLGLILNDLQNRVETKRLLVEKLRLFYEEVEDVTTKVQGGTIQVFFHEKGLSRPVPAARLSDGTLHYLCLLTILLHPDPPPLVCIEEPELGLHPDIIPTIADLLVEASQRMQLIVTTHSDSLVSALSRIPESVVVCERDDQGTHLRRLDPEHLKEWLERYSLGDLWVKGEIGGNRW
jgi:predicted ATPase